MKSKGLLIDFEGGDGGGKGTQAKKLAEHYKMLGHQVVHTREPGGTPTAELIRNLILRGDLEDKLSPVAEILLFSASRAQHVDKLIRPALEAGKIVITERFYPSTFAYQHYGRGVDRDLINRAVNLSVGNVHPDIVLILDIPVKEGLRRKAEAAAKEGAPALDRFEQEKLDFHQRIRNAYLTMATTYDNYMLIDASRPIENVFDQILSVIETVDV